MLQIAVKSEIAKVMTAISPSSRDAKLMMQAELAAHKTSCPRAALPSPSLHSEAQFGAACVVPKALACARRSSANPIAESWLPGSISAASGEGACCKVFSDGARLAALNHGHSRAHSFSNSPKPPSSGRNVFLLGETIPDAENSFGVV